MISKTALGEIIAEYREEVLQYKVSDRDITLEGFSNQVLVGVRRSGKSYILYRHIQKLVERGRDIKDIIFLNFEDERLLGMELSDLNSILEVQMQYRSTKPILFFDELQNIEGWEKFARRLADQKYSVYITGSNSKMLSKDVASSLGGRYLIREIFPLNFDEYLKINGIYKDDQQGMSARKRAEKKKYFESYYRWGGFPESAHLSVKRDYLNSLYQKIFLGDIALRNKIDNIAALKLLFRKLAESLQQPLSISRLANIISTTGVKVGKATVGNYLQYAEDSCLIFSIPNISGHIAEKYSNQKYYFIDNGILALLALDIETQLLENLVAVTLVRKYGLKDAVYHYRNGFEVDFYIPETETAIQVCYSLNKSIGTKEREIGGLIKLSSLYSCRRKLIVTYEEEGELDLNGERIEILPIQRFIEYF